MVGRASTSSTVQYTVGMQIYVTVQYRSAFRVTVLFWFNVQTSSLALV